MHLSSNLSIVLWHIDLALVSPAVAGTRAATVMCTLPPTDIREASRCMVDIAPKRRGRQWPHTSSTAFDTYAFFDQDRHRQR
jgi:hypothetical protein